MKSCEILEIIRNLRNFKKSQKSSSWLLPRNPRRRNPRKSNEIL
jgi:hypothetical protein